MVASIYFEVALRTMNTAQGLHGQQIANRYFSRNLLSLERISKTLTAMASLLLKID
jgi:hypothetical protein